MLRLKQYLLLHILGKEIFILQYCIKAIHKLLEFLFFLSAEKLGKNLNKYLSTFLCFYSMKHYYSNYQITFKKEQFLGKNNLIVRNHNTSALPTALGNVFNTIAAWSRNIIYIICWCKLFWNLKIKHSNLIIAHLSYRLFFEWSLFLSHLIIINFIFWRVHFISSLNLSKIRWNCSNYSRPQVSSLIYLCSNSTKLTKRNIRI